MQAEFVVELGEGADRLEIPWADPDDPANRFYNLRAEPALLAQVVEARANPALRGFLQSVNAPASFFGTAKCDTWTSNEFSAGERASFPTAGTKYASYVDLFFARDEFNFLRQHYEQLARRLAQQLTPEPAAARTELCLRHCYYRERKAWGYYLTIFLYGYAADPSHAQQQWTAGLATLGRALRCISELLQQALKQAQAVGASPSESTRRGT